MNDGLPFRALMATGLGVLGWTPDAFWSATPDELRAALEGRFGRVTRPAPVARAEYDALRRRFTDAAKG